MTYYTGLARVARTTGYPVVEIPGWKLRGHGHMGAVLSVIAHHTAGGTQGNAPSLNVVTNGRAGLAGPLSHYVLGRDGTIYVVAAGLCAHAGKDSQVAGLAYRNVHAIGIEAENTGVGEKWPEVQLDAYVKLCAALVKEFGLTSQHVKGHKEIATPAGRKIDPNFSANGISMGDFRAAVAAGQWGEDTLEITPVSSVKPVKSKKWPTVALPATSSHTTASHAAWVKLMEDIGYTDNDLGKNLQRWLSKLGYYKGAVDGNFLRVSTKALQKFLKAKGHYKGVVDGSRGGMTIKAEIAYLNSQRKHY